MIEKLEVKKLIENGLKECLSLASFAPVEKKANEAEEFVSTEELLTENENIFNVLEVANDSGAIRIVWNLDNKDFALEFSDDASANPDTGAKEPRGTFGKEGRRLVMRTRRARTARSFTAEAS